MTEPLPLDSVHVDLVLTDSAEAISKRHEYLPLMSAEEHVRMGRLVFERDRHRFLLTRALVRNMLSRYAAVAPADWQFIANAHGRPEILDRPAAVPDLRFNISHTDGLIACAVTIGREVGVDVEYVGRHLTQDIAARFFAPAEVAHLKALPDPDQERVFFDFWTLKEAYIKARGFGLALPLGEFAFHLSPDGPPSISIEPSLNDDPATWQFLQDWPTPSHRLGLAIRRTGKDLPVRMRQIVP